jgi:hypothetical protein
MAGRRRSHSAPIDIDDRAAVHEWASTIEACRYQAWGPTVAETVSSRSQVVDGARARLGMPCMSNIGAADSAQQSPFHC